MNESYCIYLRRIQDFPEGAPTPRQAQTYYSPYSYKNCIEIKKIGPGARPNSHCVDPPLITFSLFIKDTKFAVFSHFGNWNLTFPSFPRLKKDLSRFVSNRFERSMIFFSPEWRSFYDDWFKLTCRRLWARYSSSLAWHSLTSLECCKIQHIDSVRNITTTTNLNLKTRIRF